MAEIQDTPAPAPAAPISTVATDEQALYCPSCGYDLRGSTSDRCSECGLEVDRNPSSSTAIAWAHRRTIGRFRAFWKTVVQVTLDSRRIRHELRRYQFDGDACSFRRWNALCVWLALFGLFAAVVIAEGWDAVIAIDPEQLQEVGDDRTPGLMLDLLVPWSAGITTWWGVPLALAGLALYLTGLGRRAYRLHGQPESRRQKAACMSAYASAPLAWLLPAAAMIVAAIGLANFRPGTPDPLNDLIGFTGPLIGWSAGSSRASLSSAACTAPASGSPGPTTPVPDGLQSALLNCSCGRPAGS